MHNYIGAHALISCFYQSDDPATLPVGFSWAQKLTEEPYTNKYYGKLTILLHGECLKFGLKSDIYQSYFGTPNPYASFLREMYRNSVKIVICDLCLQEDGFNTQQLLGFIQPIPFSVDYMLDYQSLCQHFVIYDAQLNNQEEKAL